MKKEILNKSIGSGVTVVLMIDSTPRHNLEVNWIFYGTQYSFPSKVLKKALILHQYFLR